MAHPAAGGPQSEESRPIARVRTVPPGTRKVDSSALSLATWGWLLSSWAARGFSVGGSEGAINAMGASDNAGYSDFARQHARVPVESSQRCSMLVERGGSRTRLREDR
jgi:hypothetical protein